MSKLPVIAYALLCTAFALDTGLSFGNAWWYYTKTTIGSTTTKQNLGLWSYCSKAETAGNTVNNCYFHTESSFPADKIYLGSTQTFQALGIVLLFTAGFTLFLKIWIRKCRQHPFLLYVSTTHAFWAAICLIGSAGSFGHGIGRTSGASTADLHFSWYGALFSGLIVLVAAFLLIAACAKGDATATSCPNSTTSETKQQPI